MGSGCCSTGWLEEEEEEERKNRLAAVSGLEDVSDRRRSVEFTVVFSPPLLLLGFSLAVVLWVVFEGTCCPGPGPCAVARPTAGEGMRREGEDGWLAVIGLP